MGVDVHGRSGKCFDTNWAWWHQLAAYCKEIAPDIVSRCKHWHTNDGDGLNGADSVALADALQNEIDSGRCAKYAAFIPRHSVGVPYLENNTWRVGKWSERPFSVTNVQEFADFLRSCGGFAIW
jgi:hypothetical protein